MPVEGVGVGSWVTAHLASGDAPAIVTRVNSGDTVSLTVFPVGSVVHRDNVPMYVAEADDEPEDKHGFWTPGLDL